MFNERVDGTARYDDALGRLRPCGSCPKATCASCSGSSPRSSVRSNRDRIAPDRGGVEIHAARSDHLSPQCGFASHTGGNLLTEAISAPSFATWSRLRRRSGHADSSSGAATCSIRRSGSDGADRTATQHGHPGARAPVGADRGSAVSVSSTVSIVSGTRGLPRPLRIGARRRISNRAVQTRDRINRD